MKSLLPQKDQGFTLIELLIAITIIAILATVGFVAFQGITARARDDKRIADLNSIRNAMEANFTSGAYLALAHEYFSSGQTPVDPTNSSNTGCNGTLCRYCSLNATPGSSATQAFTSCATEVTAGTPGAGGSYVVCTNLESQVVNGKKYYCVSNAQ